MAASARMVGRYAMFDRIASGGMATVHLGRFLGPAGFSRVVAIKKLNEEFEDAPEAIAAFVDEARLAARVRHPNVVQTLDVLLLGREVFLVLEYVHGEALHRLIKRAMERGETVPVPIASAIIVAVLEGLHAAHEAKNENFAPLGIVHRDVSPQNVIVGEDGVTRVLDFGIAKAEGRLQTTRPGGLKGKQGYIAPEALIGEPITRAADIFASSIVLWEMLARKRLFGDSDPRAMIKSILEEKIDAPSAHNSAVSAELDQVVLKGLARDPRMRFESARAMAIAVEKIGPLAPARDVAEWVKSLAAAELGERARRVAEVERIVADDSTELIELPGDDRPDGEAEADPDRTRGDASLLDVRAPVARPARRWSRVAWAAMALLILLAGAIALAGARFNEEPARMPEPAAISTVAPDSPKLSSVPVEDPQLALPLHPRKKPQRLTPSPSPPARETKREAEPNKCDPPYWIDKQGIRHLLPECE